MKPPACQQGFTLMELVVAMGILAGFLVMLVQLLNSGVDLVEEGESGQILTDRAQQAAREVREGMETMRGPSPGVEPREPDARLWVQWVPPRLVPQEDTGNGVDVWQVLRATVDLDPATEERLREPELARRAELEAGDLGEQAVEKRLGELRAEVPLLGRGGMWLLPWPAGDPDGAYLELRRALFPPGALLEVDQDLVDPIQVPYLAPPDITPALALAVSEPLVRDLLHIEYRLWSQFTRSWDIRPGRDGGPEQAWDSARSGWLPDPPPLGFSLDLHPASLQDTTDDVFPHWVHVTLVVGTGVGTTPDTLLAEDIGAEAKEVRVVNPDRLPELDGGAWVKIGSEWVRYAEVDGYRLRGLQRGQRNTAARPHVGGTGVRAGRTVTFQVRVSHGVENWNG